MTKAIENYLDLITAEHGDKPNFLAAVTAALKGFVDESNMLEGIPGAYDLDTAVGSQLDVVGQWIGLSRRLNAPITGVYFAFDTLDVGFDQGVWFGPGDPTEGVVLLDDTTYRLMLYAKIAANIWNGQFGSLQEILQDIFVSSPGTLVFVQDNFDMSISIGVAGTVPSVLFISLLSEDYIPFRPAAVLLDGVYATTVDGAPLFGFDVENDYISGFDVGAWGGDGSTTEHENPVPQIDGGRIVFRTIIDQWQPVPFRLSKPRSLVQ